MENNSKAMNTSKIHGTIDTISNLSITVVAVILSVVLIKVYIQPAQAPRNSRAVRSATTKVGTNLKNRLPGVDWSGNGKTLIVAISTHCHLCTDSAPFLHRLEEKASKNVKMVAVLPESVSEAKQYLGSHGLHIDQVRQISLGSIGVMGTPTMLLVDGGGVVTRVWTGKIQPPEQDQVLNAIRG